MGVFSKILSLLATWALLFVAMPTMATEPPPLPNLSEDISVFEAQRKGPGPGEAQRAILDRAARDLAAAMPEPGLEVGSRAPDFSLPDAHGNQVRLSSLLEQGPVIVTFYRGAWCPYCNLQLKALREGLPHFERHGLPVPGTLVVDRDGIVRASFADTDYKKRMEPAAILEVLEGL